MLFKGNVHMCGCCCKYTAAGKAASTLKRRVRWDRLLAVASATEALQYQEPLKPVCQRQIG